MKNSHGDKCDCQILSLAITGKPSVCHYDFCINVLQRRWTMTCNHGQQPSTEKPPVYEPVVMHEDGMLNLLKKTLG